MPQVKIHMSQVTKTDEHALVEEIRSTLVEVLGIKENIGQVMLYKTPAEFRSIHASREQDFVFVEITMYPGRTQEMKQTLCDKLSALINKHTQVGPSDIICCIIEVTPENYFGGL
ncbi:MAG: tautomerase family protein [Firmicutes bacterium]|nr:tautomerase family protein [Bacillota bacterium]NLL88605.1 tautomerase family protein [Bacillota bacterium]HKM17328.1 tautomerase family protein [Limnochordia bacterium]